MFLLSRYIHQTPKEKNLLLFVWLNAIFLAKNEENRLFYEHILEMEGPQGFNIKL